MLRDLFIQRRMNEIKMDLSIVALTEMRWLTSKVMYRIGEQYVMIEKEEIEQK